MGWHPDDAIPQLSRPLVSAMSREPDLGQNSDTASSADDSGLARELDLLARIGLTVRALTEHSDKCPLLRARAAPGAPQLAERAVIELVTQACARLTSVNERYGLCATLLFGARTGDYGRSYARRNADAADCWREGLSTASFNKRHRAKVVGELAEQVISLTEQAKAPFRLWLERDPAFRPISAADNAPNYAFVRRQVRAITYIMGSDRRPAYTDWHYLDVTHGGVDVFRISTKQDDARVDIEALSSNVTILGHLGVDPFGSQGCGVRFDHVPGPDEEIEWAVRKRFAWWTGDQPDQDWLSVGVTQGRSIEAGTFELDFKNADEQPSQVIEFITPKQTLPYIRGTQQPAKIIGRRAVAVFEDLQPWFSYGLMWHWPHALTGELIETVMLDKR